MKERLAGDHLVLGLRVKAELCRHDERRGNEAREHGEAMLETALRMVIIESALATHSWSYEVLTTTAAMIGMSASRA